MGERIVIAVMDTGCDLAHPDLAPNAWLNRAEIPGNGIDDDGNGFIDDLHGWNFGDGGADLSDKNGHGTHVASIAAAAGVNRVSGVAPAAQIMCLKVQDGDGRLFASYMFAAYQYALDMGAHIVVNSFSNTYWAVPTDPAGARYATRWLYIALLACLSAPGMLPEAGMQHVGGKMGWRRLARRLALERPVVVALQRGCEGVLVRRAGKKDQDRMHAYGSALQALNDAGVLVMAAAGNEQVSNDALSAGGFANVPCNVPLDNVIAVGATDKTQARWAQGAANSHARVKGSNYGADTVDLGAPGARIVGAQSSLKGSKGYETRCVFSRFALVPLDAGAVHSGLSRCMDCPGRARRWRRPSPLAPPR